MSRCGVMRRGGRRGVIGSVVLAAALCCATLTAAAGPAAAAHEPHGRTLKKPCLELRSSASIYGSQLNCIPYNTSIGIECTLASDQVRGPFGVSRIWDRTTYKATTGFVTDALVNTGTMDPVAPSCLGRGKGSVVRSPCMRLRSDATFAAPANVCVPYNTVLTIDCTKRGEAVLGPWGTSTIWDHTTYLNRGAGYLPDAWVWTGTAAPTARPC